MKSTFLALILAGFAFAEPVVQPAQILKQGAAPQRYLYGAVHAPGQVKLEVALDARGQIKGYKVLNGRPDLTPAAIQMVHDWTFQPATVDGRAVPSRMEVIVGFTFKG